MKKIKGTGAMIFSIVAVMLYIICVFILAGNGAKKRQCLRRYVWDFFFTGEMIPLSAPFVPGDIRNCKKSNERTEGIKM